MQILRHKDVEPFCLWTAGVLCCLLLSCSSVRLSRESQSLEIGVVQQLHEELHSATDYPSLYEDALGARSLFDLERLRLSNISEILMGRSGCFGYCEYSLGFARNGSAKFFGERYPSRRGCFQALVSEEDFLRLAAVLNDIGFGELEHSYIVLSTDSPAAYVAVMTRGGSISSVWDYSGAGPARLWAVERLLDIEAEELDWEPLSSAKTSKECFSNFEAIGLLSHSKPEGS